MATLMREIEAVDYDNFISNMKTKYLKIKDAYTNFSDELITIGEENPFYDQITVSGNPAIEVAMLSGAYNADNSFGTTEFSTYIKANTSYTGLIRNFETAITNGNGITSNILDTFLFANNIVEDTLGNEIYYLSKNNYLLAYNVGCETEEKMGSFAVTEVVEESSSSSSSSSSISYTNNYNFATRPKGIYSTTYSATKRATLEKDTEGNIISIAYAPTQIRFERVSGTGDVVLQITGINTAGTSSPVSETITIPSVGGEATTTNKYVYLTSILVTNGSDGQEVEFYNIPYEVYTVPVESSSSSSESSL